MGIMRKVYLHKINHDILKLVPTKNYSSKAVNYIMYCEANDH